MTHEVLISYSKHDKLQADAICNRLESKGIRCWIAPRDVPVGTEYADSIVQAIESSDVLLLVYSSHADQSKQVKREVERAVSAGIKIMPVRIENAEMSKAFEYYVGSIHWLDAITPPLEKHIDKLALELKALLSVRDDLTTNERADKKPAVTQATPVTPDTSASKQQSLHTPQEKTPAATVSKPEKSGSKGVAAAVVILGIIAAVAGFLFINSEDNGGQDYNAEIAESAYDQEAGAAVAATSQPEVRQTATERQRAADTNVRQAEVQQAYTEQARVDVAAPVAHNNNSDTYYSLVEQCSQQFAWKWSCDVPAITTMQPFLSGACKCSGRILQHIETGLFRCEALPQTCGGVDFVNTLGYEPEMEWYEDVTPY